MTCYDLVVIGAGSGGLAASRKAASYGKKVAIIEKYRTGGTCVIRGCVPKKMCFNLANLYGGIHHHFNRYGITVDNPKFDYPTFKLHRDKYIEKLEQIYTNNLSKDGVELIKGTAIFSNDAVERSLFNINVDTNSGPLKIQSKQLIIACGLKPNWPSIPGSDLGISSDEFFLLNYIPSKVVVVGAGYIAVELAGVLRSLGSDVTLVVRSKVLRTFDEMIRTEVANNLIKNGVKIVYDKVVSLSGTSKRTWDQGRNILVKCNNNSFDNVDEVLFAIGRIPDIDRLGLHYLNINMNNGFIDVNDIQETNVPNVYAIGDITGNHELTPVAIKAGRTLGDRLYGNKSSKVDYSFVPSVVFSHPPVGCVGLTEEEAKSKYNDIKIYQSTFVNLFDSPYANLPVEVAMGYSGGLEKQKTKYKIICKGENEKIIGLHMVGNGSDEILQGFAVAIRMGATKDDFDSTIAIHPTAAEELVTMK
eukprot:NODE_579_length_6479_cov_0.371160.p2 type:complete len:474 gc:universal NODE_579_length_6479_cov_0.371160:832-2253(+)